MKSFVVAAAAISALAFLPAPSGLDELAKQSLAQIDGRVTLAGLRDSVQVIRDRWGVPHIYASNLEDLFFAQGYVQAQDRLWQMEMYRRTFEGSLAEILGPAYVEHDRLMRLLRYRGPFDESEWSHYHPQGRLIFESFARGVNAFVAAAGNNLPVEFKLTGLRPKPWTADIALLRTQTAMPTGDAIAELRLAAVVAGVGAEEANRRASPWPARLLVVPNGVDYSRIDNAVLASFAGMRTGTVRPAILPPYRAAADSARENGGAQGNSPGSNNWVVSGKLNANGHVVVANDPHRSVSNPSIRYLVHLNAPGWNVIGATEAVLPGVMIGHTDHIGWGLTIVGTDQADVYVEETSPDHARTRFRDAWEPMQIVLDTIPVKDAAPVVVTHRFTRHGPVFHLDTVHHRAYAMRSTMHMPGSAGYLSALRYHAVKDCVEFLEAQRYYRAPSENMICGDTKGNIAWQASAASPKRPNWHGRLPVPGTGEYEWDGLRADLPRELNPKRGWIATANHNIHPPRYDPPLFFSQRWADHRFDRLKSVFDSGRRFTMRDHQALQHDAFSPDGAHSAGFFQGWSADRPELERARAALATWDGQHRRESFAAALYVFVRRALTDEVGAGATAATKKRVLEPAIARGLDSLRARFGDDPAQWRWGRFNRSEFRHPLARPFDIPGVERHGGNGFVADDGATFREIIDMQDLDASLATNAPGQSGQPGSPFYANLAEMFGRAEYFPLAFSRAAVERHAAHRLTLRPGR